MRARYAITIIALQAATECAALPSWYNGYSKDYELRYKGARRRRAARKAVSRWVKEQCVRPILRAHQRVTQPPRNHACWRRPG